MASWPRSWRRWALSSPKAPASWRSSRRRPDLWRAEGCTFDGGTPQRLWKGMPLHLIKLCVGCDSVDDLKSWVASRLKEKKRRGQKPEHIHTTRMVPKRAEELTDGGSL